MAKEVILFESEQKTDLQSAATFLHQLADKLAQNQVKLRQGEQEITLDIPNNLVLEIKVEEEVKKKRTERSLELELEWIVGDDSGGAVTLG
jgi:amphi-Trp domain-containing protein